MEAGCGQGSTRRPEATRSISMSGHRDDPERKARSFSRSAPANQTACVDGVTALELGLRDDPALTGQPPGPMTPGNDMMATDFDQGHRSARNAQRCPATAKRQPIMTCG